MTCELWVRGDAENGGHFAVNVVWRSGWTKAQGLPKVAFQSSGGAYDFYSDGLGGNFSGTGWYSAPQYYLKGCDDEACDCLNGGCIPASTYKTPGKYPSLAACQSGCAKDLPCDGECIPATEIAALQQAASNLRARMCK